MAQRYPCGGLSRRQLLASAASAPLIAAATVSAQERKPEGGKLGIPGPYPGRIVEVRNPKMVRAGVKNREAVKAAVDRGMKVLTGADHAVEAWRSFFEPGDVVGIKMNPVGNPLANSSSELMLEVIEGLKAAGVKLKDMVVFDRYKKQFTDARMHEAVPDGVAWDGITNDYDDVQLDLKGYDRDEFVTMELVGRQCDPTDDRARRSHIGLLVTRRVNKIVLLPVLKDHASAGVTGALKNMSHGLVNNVARSHSAGDANVCNQFIPQVVSHPIIRKKCILHVMDGIIGVYQGGPSSQNPAWTWECNTLLFGTDPVAMDRVEWKLVDAQRLKKGLAPVDAVGKLAKYPNKEGFDIRQPQHIVLAGSLGLGIFNDQAPKGSKHAFDHRVVTMS